MFSVGERSIRLTQCKFEILFRFRAGGEGFKMDIEEEDITLITSITKKSQAIQALDTNIDVTFSKNLS